MGFSLVNPFRNNEFTVKFLQPYWDEQEISLGLGYTKINRGIPGEFIYKFKQVTGLEDWVIVPTGSGRTALEVALKVLAEKYPARTEVILPSYGCKGTLEPVIKCGLTPVFTDINYDLLPSDEEIIKNFSSKTLACLAVNLTGKSNDWNHLIAESKKHNSFVIIDDCQNLHYQNLNRLCRNAEIKIFSFGIGKNTSATAGGAVAANIYINSFKREAKALKTPPVSQAYKRFGFLYQKYFGHASASNMIDDYSYSGLNILDAGIMLTQLDKLQTIINKRVHNVKAITAGIDFNKSIRIQSDNNHIYTKFPVLLENPKIRDNFFSSFRNQGIELEGMYIPLHLRGLSHAFKTGCLKNTLDIYPNVYNIPVRPQLSETEIKRIHDVLADFINKHGK